MNISHEEFKAANSRLQEKLTYSEVYKALKKPLSQILSDKEQLDIEIHLGTLDKQNPDKRLIAQWLSTALADQDYNAFVAKLKSGELEATTEAPDSIKLEYLEDGQKRTGNSDFFHQFADKIDFESFEKSLIEFIEGRYKHHVLESDFEIMATAITIINIIFGQNKWTNMQTFKMIGQQGSISEKIENESKTYWIQTVTIPDQFGDEWEHYTIAYEYQNKDSDQKEPSDDEVEEKELEYMTEAMMKDRFAWNLKYKQPVTINKGRHEILIEND